MKRKTHIESAGRISKKAQSKFTRRGVLGKAQRFEVISDLENHYPITWLCRIAEVSRAGFYKWRTTSSLRMHRSSQDGDLKEHILAIHRLHPYYGYKRMRTALQRGGLQSIADSIKFYNSEQFQKKLSDLSPREYREKATA